VLYSQNHKKLTQNYNMLDTIVGKAAAITGISTINTPIEILKMRMNTNV